MKISTRGLFFLLTIFMPLVTHAALLVGIGNADITPPIGTPSAGYRERRGDPMQGVHDPLVALALFIDNGEKQVVFCSVDHLGFTYEMVQQIIQRVHLVPQLKQAEVYIGSSHTHSGGGAYLNIPVVGEGIAGPYNADITQFYIEKTIEAIIQSSQNPVLSKIGIGYGKAEEDLSIYRGSWPKGIIPVADIAVIKVTKLDETPLAILFNYAVHPTVLTSQNRLFSSDFVGYARNHLKTFLGDCVQTMYFNGAQGDIIPFIFNDKDRFLSCKYLGETLAETIVKIWNEVEVKDSLLINTQKEPYDLKLQATPFGTSLPLDILLQAESENLSDSKSDRI